jgi:HTH-type transcriptional regulator, competence development regulator
MTSHNLSIMNNFGQKIRNLRHSNALLLRHVAAAIDIDQALLSKIERGERVATKNQVISLAKYYMIDERELLTIWLGEKIAYEIKDEDVADDALKIAEETIHYLRKPKGKPTHVQS